MKFPHQNLSLLSPISNNTPVHPDTKARVLGFNLSNSTSPYEKVQIHKSEQNSIINPLVPMTQLQ